MPNITMTYITSKANTSCANIGSTATWTSNITHSAKCHISTP